jgi:hypothetical protein
MEVAHPMFVRKNDQCAISFSKSPDTGIGRSVRKPHDIIPFISRVNNRAAGTANEKETHFPTRR